MKHGRFLGGLAVGIAIGAIAPVLAQQGVDQNLANATYGVPRGNLIFILCTDANGNPINGSSLHAGAYTRYLGTTGQAQGYGISCNL